jgi:hypothetical protein
MLTAKVRVNTIHAPHCLSELLRFSERLEAPCVTGFDCSVRIVVLVIDTEVVALLLGAHPPFEVPAHVFYVCHQTRFHDANADTVLLGDDWLARMNVSSRRV